MIVIITIIFAIAVGVYMVNHPETWNGSYCINGDCVYKDYGDSAFTSLAIMPLAALIGRCGKCWKYWDSGSSSVVFGPAWEALRALRHAEVAYRPELCNISTRCLQTSIWPRSSVG